MKALRDLYLLFWRPFAQMLQNPIFVIVNLLTPLLYIVLFLPLLQNSSVSGFSSSGAVQLFVPGIIALLFAMTGLNSLYPLIFELKKGFVERLRVTPTSRFAILMGPILSWNVWTLISAIVLVAFGTLYGFQIHLTGLLLFAVLLILLLTIFAAWAAAFTIIQRGNMTTINAVVVPLNLPLLLLGGVMLPLSLAPDWMRIIAYANPLYYVVEAGRDLAMGHIDTSTVTLAFIILVPLAILVVWWATHVYRKAIT